MSEQQQKKSMLHLKMLQLLFFHIFRNEQENNIIVNVHFGAGGISTRGTDNSRTIPKSLSNLAKLQYIIIMLTLVCI